MSVEVRARVVGIGARKCVFWSAFRFDPIQGRFDVPRSFERERERTQMQLQIHKRTRTS